MQYRVIFFVLVNYPIFALSQSSDYELQLVQVLFRHGDRTPSASEVYPKDPHNFTAYEPFGLGQLTNGGKRRVYQLGQLLRKRYGAFLGETYRPGLVFGYSTNVERTKASLQLALAGLFPPEPELQWNEDLDWNPIPTNYNPDSFDFLSTAYYCRVFEKIWNAIVASPEVQRTFDQHRDFVSYLANSTGLPNQPDTAISLHENVHSQINQGLKFPEWCTDEVYKGLQNITAFRYDVYVATDRMKKIVVGPLIRRFLSNIRARESGLNEPRIYLYAAHDDNVATFLRTHGFVEPRLADYGSAVLIEMFRRNDTQTYIRILFYPGSGNEFQVRKLEQCDKICPLSKYMKIMKPVLPLGEGTQCLYPQAYKDVENIIKGLDTSPPNKLKLLYVKL